ncbi:MAG TPA: hypothetical protein DIS65_09570 [Candidatus Marinimicrobia bacterium]|nr:hypothetical protein [Candidatus Neomarinimicrobiota bacterium]|tara:strand:- start:650 stop:1756 length:1107 start_codon:yes stop_codon:yes gene_type:complete
MNKSITTFVLFLVLIGSASLGQEKTFHLKSGDTVTGTVTSETDSTYSVKTAFGEIDINKKDVKQEEAFIFLKSGDKLRGIIISESDEGVTVKAKFGEVFVSHDKIERIDFKSMGRARGQLTRPGQVERGRWYYGNERLIDIYFDPTGYTLEENVLYLSGLSWGYGLSDKVHITSKWGGYFFGDLNFRPKFMLFKKGDIKSEQALSIGFHYHMRGLPNKYELKDRFYDPYNDSDKEWVRVGSEQDEEGFNDDPSGGEMWWEAFGAYTVSNLKASGQGRINHTVGASATLYPGYDLMPRAYYAVNADVRRSLKLLFEVFWDPYWASMLDIMEEKEVSEIDFDFGFIYAYSEQFRFGIHFQRPWIAFYYKF